MILEQLPRGRPWPSLRSPTIGAQPLAKFQATVKSALADVRR